MGAHASGQPGAMGHEPRHGGPGEGEGEGARARMFQTRTHSWREVGLARQLSRSAVKRARVQLVVLLPVMVGLLLVWHYRDTLFGRAWDTPVRICIVVALIMVGWQFARDAGRAFGPTLFRHMDPGTAGSVGFLIR